MVLVLGGTRPWSKRRHRLCPSFCLSPAPARLLTSPIPMGQQYNKVIKRRRRRAYLERAKARIKAARSTKKKTSKK